MAPLVAQQSSTYTSGDTQLTVHVQVVLLGASLVAWLGAEPSKGTNDEGTPRGASGHLSALAFAATTRFDTNAASSAALINKDIDDPSEGVARRIATRTKLNCFVVCDLPNNAQDLLVFAEKQLMKTVLALLESQKESIPAVAVETK
ncbi:hypothetical protein HDU98_011218 [Podochytrium sp. JEL0797]|nr:hypothetical protein HDU98_011218 [Podochytrium sp. JEL0797]